MSTQRLNFSSGVLFGAGWIVLVGGCASAPADDELRVARALAVGESGYRSVTVTGSHIPVLVPTSPTARPLPAALPVRTISPDELDRLVRRGQR